MEMIPLGMQLFILENPETSSIASIDHYLLACCIFPAEADFQKGMTSFVRINVQK